MKLATKTLDAIDKAIVANADNGHRRHLGASVIGKECDRRLWYGFRWVLKEEFDGRMLRLFQRGHDEEPRVEKLFRAIGVSLTLVDPKTGKQFRIEDHNGHFGGSCDGVLQGVPEFPKLDVLFECKTYSDKQFDKLESGGVIEAKWEHFVQMQVYLFKLELPGALYFAVNKNDDRIHAEFVQTEKNVAKDSLKRAGFIINADTPPDRVSNSPGDFRCKFCHLNRLCHFRDVVPEKNCRTCKWSSPGPNGEWDCGQFMARIPKTIEPVGCEGYSMIPELMKA